MREYDELLKKLHGDDRDDLYEGFSKDLQISNEADVMAAQVAKVLPDYEFLLMFAEHWEGKPSRRLRRLIRSRYKVDLRRLTSQVFVELFNVTKEIAFREYSAKYGNNALTTTPSERNLGEYLLTIRKQLRGLTIYPPVDKGNHSENGKFYIGPYSFDRLIYGAAIMDNRSPMGTVVENNGDSHHREGKVAKDEGKEALLRKLGFSVYYFDNQHLLYKNHPSSLIRDTFQLLLARVPQSATRRLKRRVCLFNAVFWLGLEGIDMEIERITGKKSYFALAKKVFDELQSSVPNSQPSYTLGKKELVQAAPRKTLGRPKMFRPEAITKKRDGTQRRYPLR